MTGNKSRMSSNIGQDGLTITELLALGHQRKKCLQLFSVIFDWLFYRFAGKEDRHKNLEKFEIQSDPIFHARVSCP